MQRGNPVYVRAPLESRGRASGVAVLLWHSVVLTSVRTVRRADSSPHYEGESATAWQLHPQASPSRFFPCNLRDLTVA